MRVTCSCGQVLEIGNEYAGRTAQCPACQKSFTVPTPAAEVPGDATAAAATSLPPLSQQPLPAIDTRAQQALLDRLQGRATGALICGVLSMVCYLVVFIILAIIGQQQEAAHGKTLEPPLVASIVVIFLSLVATILSIVSIAFGIQGKKPENTRNRGIGLAGMIVGIVGASLSACCLLFFLVMFGIGFCAGVSGAMHH